MSLFFTVFFFPLYHQHHWGKAQEQIKRSSIYLFLSGEVLNLIFFSHLAVFCVVIIPFNWADGARDEDSATHLSLGKKERKKDGAKKKKNSSVGSCNWRVHKVAEPLQHLLAYYCEKFLGQ